MKKIWFALALASGLSGCKKEVALGQTEATLGQPIALVSKQPVTLPTSSGSPISLTLTEVNDSRCPSGAQCIWAGYAAVTVELTDASSTVQTARLSLLNKPSAAYSLDSVTLTLNQQAYWLRLVAVNPYPSTTTGNQPQTATIRLRAR
jgi:hypothetical protein